MLRIGQLCPIACQHMLHSGRRIPQHRPSSLSHSAVPRQAHLWWQCPDLPGSPAAGCHKAGRGGTPASHGASYNMDTLCCRGTMSGRTQQAVYATNQVQKPQELVTIVDEQNNVIGQATRQEMRSQNAIHRCSFTIVSNSKDEVFVQKRVSFKETYPGFYDPAPGGVVGADESYELNAERELEEEMGVQNAQLQHCFDFYHADKVTRLWGRLFTCTYDGEMKLDPEEVESGQFMSWAEVRQLLQTQDVTPDSKACVEQYLQQHAK